MYGSDGISKRYLLGLALIFSIFLSSCISLVYVDGKDVWKMGADGSGKQKLAAGDYPRWRPGGKEIVFFEQKQYPPLPGESESGEIWIMYEDGTNLRQLTDQQSGNFFSFSPDGNWIVFQSYRDGSWQIYKMQADGSNQTRLTHDNFINECPKWSPREDKIVFQSRQAVGKDVQICVMDPNGAGRTNPASQMGPGDFRHPVWSPDGKYIAFEGRPNNLPTCWSIYVADSLGQNIALIVGHISGKIYTSPAFGYGNNLNNYYIFYHPTGGKRFIYRKLFEPNKNLGNEELLPINKDYFDFDLTLSALIYIFYTEADVHGNLFISRMNYKDGSEIKELGKGYRPYCAGQ